MKSLKTTARLTGLGYLVIFITGFFANFYTLESMMVDNDAQMTASNIISQLAQYRMGMLSFSIMVLMDIILAVPLYQLLKKNQRDSGFSFLNFETHQWSHFRFGSVQPF